MKRIGSGIAAVLLIGAFFALSTRAQGPSLPPGEYDLEAGQYMFNQHPESLLSLLVMTLTPVPSETPTTTDTPVPPTNTPIPPSATLISPSGHDSEVYHGLWNGPLEPFAGAPSCQSMGDTNCHWNHTHNADPSRLDSIFGPVGALYGGQTISYQWQTGTAPNLENQVKHEGYKWMVRQDGADGDCLFYAGQNNNAVHCVTDFRIQQHVVGGQVGVLVRFHSYWVEMRVCTLDQSVCGIVKTGGHSDFGLLQVERYSNYVPLPGDPPEFADCTPQQCAYRGHKSSRFFIDFNPSPAHNDPLWFNGRGLFGFNQISFFAFITEDDWGGIAPDDPAGPEHFLCPDWQCKFNHSTLFAFEVYATVSSAFDPDGDGIADFSGFTDRKGNVVADCAPLGPDCVPLEIAGVPVGNAAYGPSGRFQFNMGFIPFEEYDVSPPGEWWIEYPN